MTRNFVALASLPALPDRGYRDRVRGILKKYRAATGQGGRTLAKACLALVPGKELPLLEGFEDPRRFGRTLDFWCNEAGDVKDNRVFFLVEELLRRADELPGGEVVLRSQIMDLGRSFSRFLAGPAPAPNLPVTTAAKGITVDGTAKPGIYVSTRGERIETNPAPTEFFIVIDVDEPDFFIAQHMQCEWKDAEAIANPSQVRGRVLVSKGRSAARHAA